MRKAILNQAESIVQSSGLEAVSFKQLADAVGLGKATVFHHFPNRDALALALIERCRTKYGEEYSTIAGRGKSAPKKLREVAASFEKGLKANRLCLLAALGSSQATLSDDLKLELKETANASVRIMTRIFQQGLDEGSLRFEATPQDLGSSFLALIQGMQQLARTSDDLDLFSKSVDAFLSAIET